jgi:hypothetical protein
LKNPDDLPTDAWFDAIEARITKLERILKAEEEAVCLG